jgi:hypothetical protein
MADVVSLAQTKAFLNITDTSADSELPFYVSASQNMWINRGGPVGTPSSPIEEWFDGGSPEITLRRAPIASITLVEESWGSSKYTLTEQASGTGSNAYAYTVDLATGTLIRRVAGVATSFANGIRNVRVQYTPGIATVPEDIQLAILLLIKHMWQTQRGIGRRPGTGGNDDEWQPREAFAWPNRCEQILAGYKIPGIA